MKMPGRIEFVALIATINMIAAFAIDSMLPALPAIGASLRIADETRWGLVITAFTFGFGAAQIFIGPISDRYGRRGLLLASLVGYALTALLAAVASSFILFLAARMAQGVATAGARVLAISIVRDRFEGRDMAQVMSLASAIFMAAPIIAPFAGTAVLAVAPWRWIFIALAFIGAAIFLWIALRMPETLAPERRRAISVASIKDAAIIVLTDRASLAYSVANACLTATVMGFLTSVTLVFAVTLKRPDLLPVGFAIMAGCMMAASFTNAAIVKRFGMRRIGHAALIGMTAMAALHVALVIWRGDDLITFVVLQSAMMVGFALAAGNFGAMAMENMGGVAGTASSIQGSFSAILGAIGGTLIGASFNGTTIPLYACVTVAGLFSIAVIWFAEGGLFVARHDVKTV
jgi:DHA1 family bicyclomycin/chloramphenicol resistance-like MFS transporter